MSMNKAGKKIDRKKRNNKKARHRLAVRKKLAIVLLWTYCATRQDKQAG